MSECEHLELPVGRHRGELAAERNEIGRLNTALRDARAPVVFSGAGPGVRELESEFCMFGRT